MKIKAREKSEIRKKDLNYYMSLEYPITLEEFEENGKKRYSLSITDLRGCGAEGDTLEEARRKLEEAKEDWISVSLDEGLPIPGPVAEDEFSGKFLLRIPPKLHMRLSKLAEKAGVSLNQFIRSILEEAVKNESLMAKLDLIVDSLNELKAELRSQKSISTTEAPIIPLPKRWEAPKSTWTH
ncbi:MAG: toxin-antitoxin system HicB family antitoxin [Thermodesulfobacteriota bacterium]